MSMVNSLLKIALFIVAILGSTLNIVSVSGAGGAVGTNYVGRGTNVLRMWFAHDMKTCEPPLAARLSLFHGVLRASNFTDLHVHVLTVGFFCAMVVLLLL